MISWGHTNPAGDNNLSPPPARMPGARTAQCRVRTTGFRYNIT
jgi:hypothetical protein